MSTTHSSPYDPTSYDDAPDAEDMAADAPRMPAWAREHLAVLKDLRDMGMQLARDLTRQVAAAAAAEAQAADAGEAVPAPPRRGAAIDPALSFSRISRAVRLTLALEARTWRAIEDAGRRGAAHDDGDDDHGLPQPIDYEGIGRRLRTRMNAPDDYHVRRAVEETIESGFDDPDDQERLKEELSERLEEDEAFKRRFTWPIGETIDLICQDLGLDPDWDRWRTRPWARKEAADSPPGSPYATAARPPPHAAFRTGTEIYREARGLPPLEGPPPLKAGSAARGPPP